MRALKFFLVGFLSATLVYGESFILPVPNGLSTFSNPLDHGDNSVGALFPTVPEGLQLYTFNATNQSWKVNQFQFGAWANPSQVLQPYQAGFFRNPTNAFSIIFMGTTVENNPPAIYPGYNLISSLPSPEFFDAIAVWNTTNQNYDPQLSYFFGLWSSPPPSLGPGDALIYVRGESSGASSNWIYFNNYIPASGIDSPIRSTLGCLGTNLFAQLFGYAGGDPSGFPLPLGQGVPVQLRNQQSLGYLDPNSNNMISIPHSATTWTFEIRYQDVRDGTNYPTATASRGRRFSYSLPNGLPYPPNNLTNLPAIFDGPLSPFWVVGLGHQPVIEGERVEFFMLNPEIYHSGFLYQWQREIGSNNWVNIPAATSTHFVIQSVTLTDGGRYRLTVVLDSCSCGTLDYNYPTLNVLQFHFLSVVPSANGQVLINGLVGSNLSFAIDYSQNLTQWTQLTTISNAATEWSVTDTNVPISPQRFYRARISE